MGALLCLLRLHAYQPSNVLPAFAVCARHCGAVRAVTTARRLGR